MSKTVILDYGVGNLRSVVHALQHCGADARTVTDPAEIIGADRVVVPGVGAFGECMRKLRDHGFDHAIRDVAASGRPLLGICVGMQMLFEESEEFGRHPGLGLIPGAVTPLRPGNLPDGRAVKIPFIGWAGLTPAQPWQGTILDGMAAAEQCYFVHSFACRPRDEAHILARTTCGADRYCSAVRSGNLWGCQFHPEKSGGVGLAILRRFLALT